MFSNKEGKQNMKKIALKFTVQFVLDSRSRDAIPIHHGASLEIFTAQFCYTNNNAALFFLLSLKEKQKRKYCNSCDD